MTLSLQEIYLSLRPPASPDPALNPRLSAILAKAREVGYPKSNVDTAMNKVSPQSGKILQVPEVRAEIKNGPLKPKSVFQIHIGMCIFNLTPALFPPPNDNYNSELHHRL
jgi:hypothetical protein